MTDQVPKAVVQERYERLVALQEDVSWAENTRQVGRTVEVLVAEGEGRKDGATHRLSGRAPDNRLVHFAMPTGAERGPGPATWPPSTSPTRRRTTWWPTALSRYAGPAPATRGRPAPTGGPAGLGRRRSACPRRCSGALPAVVAANAPACG